VQANGGTSGGTHKTPFPAHWGRYPPPTVGRKINHYTALELAEMALPDLPTTKRRISARAVSEGWPFVLRTPEGGGTAARCYPASALPEAARVELARRAVAEPGADAALAVAEQSRTALAAAQVAAFEALPAHARRVAEARAAVLRSLAAFEAALGPPRHKALASFAEAHAAGADLGLSAAAREAAGERLSVRTLRRWEASFASGGLVALAPSYGSLGGRVYESKIDAVQDVRQAVEGAIHQMGPRLCLPVLHRDLVRAYGDAAPSLRALQAWVKRWRDENAHAALFLDDPPAYKGRATPAVGSRSATATHLNALWEMDSTLADVELAVTDAHGALVLDKKGQPRRRRYALVGVVDVFSRRAMYLVAETSSSAAVRLLFARAMRAWGIPERVKVDNGKDYVSEAMLLVCQSFGVSVERCAPFRPDQKPHIERLYKTLQHSEMAALPAFVGHDVAERQKRRARSIEKSAAEANSPRPEGRWAQRLVGAVAFTPAEFQAWLDAWCVGAYGLREHTGLRLGGRHESPVERARRCAAEARHLPDGGAVALLLDPLPSTGEGTGVRVVGRKGIRLPGRDAFGQPRYAWDEALVPLIGQRVEVYRDPSAPGRVAVYHETRAGRVFACWAAALESEAERQQAARLAQGAARAHLREVVTPLAEAAKAARSGEMFLRAADEAAERAASELAVVPRLAQASPTDHMAAASRAAGAAAALDAERVLREGFTADEAAEIARHEAAFAERRAAEDAPAVRPLFAHPDDRAAWLLANPEAWRADDADFFAHWQATSTLARARVG